jgi:hypothetical protein
MSQSLSQRVPRRTCVVPAAAAAPPWRCSASREGSRPSARPAKALVRVLCGVAAAVGVGVAVAAARGPAGLAVRRRAGVVGGGGGARGGERGGEAAALGAAGRLWQRWAHAREISGQRIQVLKRGCLGGGPAAWEEAHCHVRGRQAPKQG